MGLIEDLKPIPGEMGTRTYVDPADGTLVENRYQEVDSILKHNAAIRNDSVEPFTKDRSMALAARIPIIVVEQWMKEGINIFDENDRHKVLAKLDDPEYAYLKTWKGKLSKRPARTYFKASTG